MKKTFFLILTTFCFMAVSAQDVQTAQIIWQTENLNTRVFSNSEKILFAKNQEAWTLASAEQRPAWCYYNFDPSTEAAYGLFYNTFAINDARNLAPKGWRINSKKDLESLQKSYEDTTSFVQAIVSEKYYADGKNSSGLNLIPESRVNLYGMFTGVSVIWCPSEDFTTNAFYYSSDSQFLGGTTFSYYQEPSASGMPVRCIKE